MKSDEKIIKNSIESLDDKLPDLTWTEEELWNRVDEKLARPKARTLSLKYIGYGIAASVILCSTLVNYYVSNQKINDSITFETYSQTEILDEEVFDESLDKETLAFINENCLKDLQICQTKEFKELKNQLDEAEYEIDNLNDMISKYGDSPSLVKSKIKIENFRSEVMRQLVQIITS